MKKHNVLSLNMSPEDFESLGSKQKFWFRKNNADGDLWLFKYSRPNTGEHWSEKAAEIICSELEIPHAVYHMASTNNEIGIVTKNLASDGCRMVMGNEVLHATYHGEYPEPKRKLPNESYVRVKEHTIGRVLGCLDYREIIQPPKSTMYDLKNLNAGDVFCGYLMLDALISNQDRHHENWAIILDNRTGERSLAPTYDHAASLGRELLDTNRKERMESKDQNRSIAQFVAKARSELFKRKTDKRPMKTLEAFYCSIERRHCAKTHWLDRLDCLNEQKIITLFNKFPPDVMTDIAKEFATGMVMENRRRLLEDARA